MAYIEDMTTCLKIVANNLLQGNTLNTKLPLAGSKDAKVIEDLSVSLDYLRDRIGVPRDMSYPAARQLRAHLNWLKDELNK